MIKKRNKPGRMAVFGFVIFTMILSNLTFYNPIALAESVSADPGQNTFSFSSVNPTRGEAVTLTAEGHRQSADGNEDGDERFIPAFYEDIEKGVYGDFTLNNGVYTSVFTPPASGTYSIDVIFQKQYFNGDNNKWEFGFENDDYFYIRNTILSVVASQHPANEALNTFSFSPFSNPNILMTGTPVTVTAAGDRQQIESGESNGAERYIPLNWSSTEGWGNDFNDDGTGTYTSSYTPMSVGNYNFIVNYMLQTWDATGAGTWKDTGSRNQKQQQIKVTRLPDEAEASNNSISINISGIVRVGQGLSIAINGDNQHLLDAGNAMNGDTRYIPDYCQGIGGGQCSPITKISGSYAATYTPNQGGTHTVSVIFKKEQFNGTQWINLNENDTQSKTVLVSGHATTANQGSSSVGLSSSTIFEGGQVTLTATGGRQSEPGVSHDDERFIPSRWRLEDDKGNVISSYVDFLDPDTFTEIVTPPGAGKYVVKVNFIKQWYDFPSGTWGTSRGPADDIATAALNVVQPANPDNNKANASPSSVTSGGSFTLIAEGDRQSEIGGFIGNERYIPTSWISIGDNESGSFALSGTSYTSFYTPSAAGDHTVTVTFVKQVWNGTVWVDTDTDDKEIQSLIAEITTADANNNSISANPASVTSDVAVTVTVSGDRQSATGLFDEDERFVPAGWTSTDGQLGPLDASSGSFQYSSPTRGTHIITATFQKQQWSSVVGEWVDVSGVTDAKTTTVMVIVEASDSGNTVSVSPDQVTSGGNVTLTAEGDRQSDDGLTEGDERYIPVSWTSTDSQSGSFANSGTEYTSEYTPSAAGTQTVTVTFQKQTWDAASGSWVDVNGATDTKTTTVEAAAATVDADNNSVSAEPASVTSGGMVTVTVSGDRQSATGLFEGDERFVPAGWTSTDGQSDSLSPSDGTFDYKPSAAGDQIVTVTFQKQTWNAAGGSWVDVNGATDTKTTTVEATAATADADNNSVYAEPGSVTSGGTVTLFAEGDRQTATGLFDGDERYLPVSWESTDSQSGSFTENGTDYTSDYTPSATGNHTVAVTFKKQKWDTLLGWEDTGVTDTKTTIASASVTADADNNSVSPATASVTTGGTVTLTATGDRQSENSIAIGDERYVPVSWASTEAGKSGSFSLNDGTYTSAYKPSRAGSFVVTVTFQKQIWDGIAWVDDTTVTQTVNVKVNEPDVPSGPQSPGPGAPIADADGSETQTTGVDVLVNGKVENAGTATTSKLNDRTVTTIAVDQNKLEAKLAAEGQHAVVTIPIKMNSNIVVGELNGQMIQRMEQKQAVLEIRTDKATYTVPAEQINMNSISAQMGKGAALQDIKVQIEIAESTVETVRIVENSANKGEFIIVAPPFDFTVRATYGATTIEVSKFNVYVERTIAIPEGVDPNKITTGIVVEPDGTVRHVPTKITVIDGIYYAVINSLTNSTYSVVWHPLEFEDVAKHWAKEAVNDMGSRMVVEGTGNGMFSPNRDITRAEFAAILVRGLGLRLEKGATAFSDVKATDWYNGAIQTAHSYGLIDGFTDGTFRPNDKITREQAMLILSQAMALTGLKDKLSAKPAEATLSTFVDAANVAAWAQGGVAASVQSGVVTGRGQDTLAPKAHMTRAEVAQVIRLLLRKSNLIN